MSGKGFFIAAVVVLTPVFLIVWPIDRDDYLDLQFARVHVRDDQAAVLQAMGRPWKRPACGWLGGAPNGCSEEFIYADPYAPRLPTYWVVDFDKNQRVLSANKLMSP